MHVRPFRYLPANPSSLSSSHLARAGRGDDTSALAGERAGISEASSTGPKVVLGVELIKQIKCKEIKGQVKKHRYVFLLLDLDGKKTSGVKCRRTCWSFSTESACRILKES